ncbi:lyase family protein [Paraburkholderia hospita]|uniref:lyase family protein n=1 Tax=Paraburkholderia hospita TaxID=169430 RepID=UPI0009C76717|nr:lyase family protein [Paraburkholderia hospita]SKD05551.1 aspartate ammonia-lyase [Paraburkholderia hospita]
MQPYRIEIDALGERRVPADALYGIHTLRGQQNFPYSGETLSQYPRFVAWIARTKLAIARVNTRHEKLTREQGACIEKACVELANGQHREALIVDPLEGSCGTSINMNINEVLANRALQLMGHVPGEYAFLDPLDHVNLGQSTSDVVLTAVKLTLLEEVKALAVTIEKLGVSLRNKQHEFDGILRIARTCLQDALPMRLGQAFGGYAGVVERGAASVHAQLQPMRALCLGATAVGTGLGTYPGYRAAVTAELSELANTPLEQADDLFDAVQNMDEFATLANTVKTVALSIAKIANDIVLLSSGPHGGIAELTVSPQQAGSSMMPGKVNPVHAMGFTQIAYVAAGAEQSVMLACAGGQLETNNFMPLIAVSLFKAIGMVQRAADLFDERVVRPLKANQAASERHLLESTAIAPVVKAKVGYVRAAALVNQAAASGQSLLEVVVNDGVASKEEMLELLRRSSRHPDE